MEWRGFELHPDTPKGGRPLRELFGARVEGMHRQFIGFALNFGVTGFTMPDRIQNTRRVMAVAELARSEGKLEPFRHAAMRAHWREQKNLEDLPTLASLAQEVGLDPEEARGAADDPAWQMKVDDRAEQARADGVTGIPTFMIGPLRVVGCQPYQVLAAAVERAGGQKRAR